MTDHVEVRRRTYHDSVRLMQVSAAVQAVAGVETALVAMGTDLNLGLLADLGFVPSDAGPDDMLVAIRAADDEALQAGLAALEAALVARAGDGATLDAPAPRTVAGAARLADASLALVSVPGPHAFVEAAEALDAGLHVMIFSDNVPVAHEQILKRRGGERGLLVMGPDCGTAIVSGVGLGFANSVMPGPVGIVGASGTGIQQVCCLLDAAGVGVRHALGTGSRDLSAAVGGAATLQGLDALDRDPAVEVIVVVSKPPDHEVAERVRAAAAACDTPAVMAFIGEGTLHDAVSRVLDVLGVPADEPASWTAPAPGRRSGTLRGLFSGGTHRGEAAALAAQALGEVAGRFTADGHVMVDLGDDEYTRGRPHPMIDQRLLVHHLEEAGNDPSVGVILLDVVLGYGAHPDPADALAPAIAGAVAAGAAVVVSLCGTATDPQGRDAQVAALHDAGASVFLSNAAAARHAVSLAKGGAG